MNDLGLKPDISDRFKLFLDDVLSHHQDKIHSVYVVGSALTHDYDQKISDINSVFVLHEMDLDFLDLLAPLGKKYGKKGIAAPLIMTPKYIDESVDVFPIEFLNIKLLHHTVSGDDIFKALDIPKSYLRRQCERELKAKLIGLRQGYIAAAGEQKTFFKGLVESYSGYMPLFKAVIVLLGKDAPQTNREILSVLEEVSGIKTAAFMQVLMYKQRKTKSTFDKLNLVFKNYYRIVEQLGDMVNALED